MKHRLLIKFIFMAFAAIVLTGCSDGEDIGMYGDISGKVTDYETDEPIANASISLLPSGTSIQTDDAGYYHFERLDPQQYTMTVQKTGYQPDRKTVTVVRGENRNVNFQLRIIPKE